MRLTPADKQRLASVAFVITLGIVGWGFVAGWFSPPPPPSPLTPEERLRLEIVPEAEARERPKKPAAAPRVVVKPSLGPAEAPAARVSEPIRLARPETGEPEPLFRGWRPEPRAEARTPDSRVGDDRYQPTYDRNRSPAGQRSVAGVEQRPEDWLRYPGEFGGHWVDDIRRDGELVELEDGSAWEISSFDRGTVRSWKPTENVSIQSVGVPPYPYRIAGRYGRGASARLVRLPGGKRKRPADSEELPVEQ